MKNFKKTWYKAVAALVILAALAVGLASCKKDGADGGPYTPPQSVIGAEGGSQ